MKRIKLMVLAAMALCAFGAVSATLAQAEDGPPAILCFVKGCAKEFEVKLKGGASKLTQLSEALTITSTTVAATIKGCEPLTGTEEKDFQLCKDQEIVFSGTESKGQKCKTGALTNGTVASLLDLHVGDETSTTGVLEPLLLAKVLNSELKPELAITCGVLKETVKGTVGCLLLPGLTLTKKLELICAVNAKFDPETGTCKLECGELEKDPFLSKLGEKFEDAWEGITLTGEQTKELFIDD